MKVRPDVAYILPMAVFLAFTFVGGQWKDWYPHSYVAKTVVVAAIIAVVWRAYTRVRWTHLGLGALFGVIGLVQWVGMETLFMSHDFFRWTRMSFDVASKVQENAFRPDHVFDAAWAMWAFIAIRWAGASLLVPVMEELFWRDYVYRNLASPSDFRLQEIGEYDRTAFWVVPLFFATVHPQWLTAIVWSLLCGVLLVKTRSIGACIVMHAVTNFLLGAYVLAAWYGFGVDQWYFW
jgi:uncharacterized protein